MNNKQQDLVDLIARFQSDAYQLLEKIGQGGFGLVYKAKQLNTGQFVAIKFLTLNPDFDHDKKNRYIDRFERETLLSSRLQHPNIVRLLDKGRCDDDLLFAVFEYVDGLTLKETLTELGVLPPVEAAEVMTQVLDALAHAHAQGVIHRDVKPTNIMLTKTGAKTHAKVLDFGIGTLVSEARQLDYKSITLTQETLGTPSYSAPEQLRGEPPTPKTDLYVWGLVFIECLTGQPAISGSSLASIFHKQLSESNVPLPAAIVGHPVGALLRRVLQKKVHERSVNIDELYTELVQLNFSNLVGELSAEPIRTAVSDNTTMVQHLTDDTQVHDRQQLYTRLSERKQITALCICLNVQSLTDEMVDHEIVDTLHRDQKNQCVDIAIRYGAFHVGSLGDTLLFYFGYPNVSDNDTRLCARAALDVISTLNKRNSLLKHSQGIATQTRIGMHTGIVTSYADSTPEGDTPNIAMELARYAGANEILCSDISRVMLESYSEFKPAQPRTFGVDGNETMTYALAGERQVEAFGFLRGTRRDHAFIGREVELETLLGLLAQDYNPETRLQPKLAHVYGEAGIGKSRLIFELRNRAQRFNHYVAQCLPEHQNNALYPIFSVLKYKYSLDAMAPEEAVKLLSEQLLSLELADHNAAIAIVCIWLNLPLAEGNTPTALSPDAQKQLLFSVLSGLFTLHKTTELTRNLFIFEDMHWADPTTVEFVNHFVCSTGLSDEQHVMVSTSRQPLSEQIEATYFHMVQVDKLKQSDTTEFIVNLFDKQTVAKNVLDLLVSRTDGIPLFIEELVNMLKQKNLVQKLNGIIDFISPDKLDQVPLSLRDSLQQKLDTLTYAKETAQLAACIGREFDYGLLVMASNHSEAQVQNNLSELVEAELILQQRKVSGDSYIFKHALVRDAAYDSMIADVKVAAHGQIATALVGHFPDYLHDNPAQVARHFAGAQNYRQATQYGSGAVNKQVKSSANDEALSLSELTLDWVTRLSDEKEKLEAELNVHGAVLPAVMTVHGYGSAKVIELSLRMKTVIEQLNTLDGETEHPLRKKLWTKSEWIEFLSLHYSAKRAEARVLGERLLVQSREEQDRRQMMVVLVHLAQVHLFDGEINLSVDEYSEALGLYDESRDLDISAEYGTDGKAQNLSCSSLSYLHLGYLDKARELIDEAIHYSEKISHDSSIAFAHLFNALYGYYTDDYSIIIQTAEHYEAKYGQKKEKVWHYIFVALLHAGATDNVEAALGYVNEMTETGQTFAIAWYIPIIVKSYLKQGKIEEATKLSENMLLLGEDNNLVAVYPFMRQILATCYYRADHKLTDRVEQLLLSSIAQARLQSAKFFELESLAFYHQIHPNLQDKVLLQRLEYLAQWMIEHNQKADVKPYHKILEALKAQR